MGRSGVALLAGGANAQCQFTSVSTQTYGLGCGQVFSVPPSISAQLDPVACALGIRVTSYAGCCNTFLRNRILALGIAQANLPLPQIAIGCTLSSRHSEPAAINRTLSRSTLSSIQG